MADKTTAGDARNRLFSRVAAMRKAEIRPAVEKSKPQHASLDFKTLPGFQELDAQRVIGEKVGISNPYFRVHDGLAGAHTSIGGRDVLNFSCYDYLGLNGHPDIVAATKAAIDRYGISCSGSRIVAGERPVHRALEQGLASHYGVDDAVVLVSGYATNVGVIGQLVGPKDLVIYDAVIHNSVLMGGLLSNATRRSFPHNDLDALNEILATTRNNYERVLIVVEGIYSMDGDWPDLPRLIEIKRKHNAWLMVDEAHALGVIGKTGGGLAELFGVDGRDVDIWMGTLSKTLVSCGGYIAGSNDLIQFIKCIGGVFVYSVGMPPLIAAAANAALELMHREPERVTKLQHNGALFIELARKRGLNVGNGKGTAVCPVMTGDSLPAALMSQTLLERGINVQPVMYPGVPAKESRLRFFLTASHSNSDIETAVETTVEEMAKIPERVSQIFAKAAQG